MSDAATDTAHSNIFAPVALDRAAEHRDDDAWIAAQREAPGARCILVDAEGAILATADGAAVRWLDVPGSHHGGPARAPSFLGLRDQVAYFMQWLPDRQPADVSSRLQARWIGLRAAGSSFGAFDAGMSAYAAALAQWQAQTRHCSLCGAPLALVSAGHRARCTACGHLHFPRTDAAVIVIVEHDGACLLGRQASWPAGRYSTLAGFVEPGETLEAAVRREVAEEAGVDVIACRYHSSQPWPFPASLMLGFTATARDRRIQRRDGELEDARWFTPGDLLEGIQSGRLGLPSPVSVSWHLVEHWLTARAGAAFAARVMRAARAA